MEQLSEVHTVTCAPEDLTGSFMASDSEVIEHTPQLPSKIVVESSYHTRSEIVHGFADLCVVTKSDVEVIDEHYMAKLTSILQ